MRKRRRIFFDTGILSGFGSLGGRGGRAAAILEYDAFQYRFRLSLPTVVVIIFR
jgi:hypothetical protein